MTQMPPPQQRPPVGYQMPGAIPPSTSNPLAIVSLICGIVGCMVITPIIGIITGFLGIAKAKPPVGGKGMAIAGIVLSVIWIFVGIGVVGSGIWIANKIPQLVATAAKQPAIDFLNDLADNNLTSASAKSNLSSDQLQLLADIMKKLGHCQDLQINSPSYANNNGVVTASFSGTGTFQNGTKNVSVEVTVQPGGIVKINEVKIE